MSKKPKIYDFSGWATKNDLRCSDGRTIRRDAFKGRWRSDLQLQRLFCQKAQML